MIQPGTSTYDSTPDYYSYSRPEIQQLINPAASRILDVGCASGLMGYELKRRLHAEVWGVENIPSAASQAEKLLDRVLMCTIEDALPQLPDGYFDTIICADVLEHLIDPWQILNSLRQKLSEAGEVVASIPNVRYWQVVKGLLEGRWPYEEAGILDRTHLRFFTRNECLRLFEATGYAIVRSEAIVLRGDSAIPDSIVTSLQMAALDIKTLSEESLHYQYAFVAKPVQTTNNKPELPAGVPSGLTSIIILTLNQLPFTQVCLESISQNTPEPYQLIMVDNGSSDGTVQWLQEQARRDDRISVFENAVNRGFAAGCNQGISAASGEYLLLLNNDTVVTEGWLGGMRELLDRYSDAGVIGPMTNSASGVQVVADVGYDTMAQLPPWAAAFREEHRYRIIPQRRIVGFCMLFRRELTDSIGLLDESFGSGNYEDDDFCLRAELAGYRNLIAGDVFIHHEGGATFSGNHIDRGNENRKNRTLFSRKWDHKGLEESMLRLWLVLHALEEAEQKQQRGDVDGAVSILLHRGIKIDQESVFPYFKLAEILLAAARYDDALEVLQEMPSNADRMIIAEIGATCHTALGNDEAARQAALQIQERPRALVALGTLAARQEKTIDAEAFFRRAIALDPSCGSAWLSLGMLLWGEGKQNEAWQAVRRSVVVNPLNNEAVIILQDMSMRLECLSTALLLIGDSVKLYPDGRNLSLTYAELLAQCGCDFKALEECERFLVRFGMDENLLARALELREHVGVHDHQSVTGMLPISLCMIVKDEEKRLARCLASIKPVVNDIVIVDTGSSDRTTDIAVAFGARVFQFPWNGNYSAARNHSLAQARGKWILVMDADEVLSEKDYPLFEQMMRCHPGTQIAWSVTTRNYTNRVESEGWHANDHDFPEQEQGDGWYPSKKVRLFPALQSVRFRGDIHEMVESDLRDLGIPIEDAGFVVHHYAELAEDDRRAKQLRYYELGKQKLLENPDDILAIVELALQAGELRLFPEALELWNSLLNRGVMTRDVYFNRSYVLMGLNRFSEASEMARKALEIDPDHKESAYNCGMSLLNLARPEQAVETVAQESAKHPDYPLLTALLCVLYLCTEEQESAVNILEDLKSRNYGIANYIRERVTVLEQLGHLALAQRLRQAAEMPVVTIPA